MLMSNENEAMDAEQGATLSSASYEDQQRGNTVFVAGLEYQVFGSASSETGFQATAYQRGDQIYIAYRGTEALKWDIWDQPVKDLGTDYQMVREQTDRQLPDADAFTQSVLAQVKAAHPDWELSKHLFVTGHSLGGTHAEIMAARYHLGGTTYNAYGAVDLGYGVPEGQPRDTPAFNGYMRASDVVSSASRHYGSSHIYATWQDIDSLHAGRYLDPADHAHPANPLLAASLSAHFISNFAPESGHDQSIMSAANEARYRQYQPAIDRYRSDVLTSRIDLHDVLNHGRDSAQAARRLDASTRDALSVTRYQSGVAAARFVLGVNATEQQLESASRISHAAGEVLHSGADALAQGTQATARTVQAVADRLADGFRGAGHRVQHAAQMASQEAVLSPAPPLLATSVALGASGAGYVLHIEANAWAATSRFTGEVAYAAGERASQVTHAQGERTRGAFEILSKTAAEAGQNLHVLSQRASGTQAHDVVVDRLAQAEHVLQAAVQHTAHGWHHAGEVVGSMASTAYETMTHPGSWFGTPPATSLSAHAHAPSPELSTTESFKQADHPQHALHETLRSLLPPQTSEARLSQATAACHMAGLDRAGQLEQIHISGKAVVILGNAATVHVSVDLTKRPPSIEQTMQQMQAFDLQQAQPHTQLHQQQNGAVPGSSPAAAR
jgi:hypothetical protein